MPPARDQSSIDEAREQIPVYPLDVFALTEKAEGELRGGSTALSTQELELLVLIDGRSNVGEIASRAKGVAADALAGTLRRLVSDGYIRAATIADEEGLDFSYFFDPDKPAPEPSPEARQKAGTEANAGTDELQQYGYYVSIARRAARPREAASESPLLVLIVEDDRHLSKLLTQLLGIQGFRTRTAAHRDEVVAALRQLPSPDLVLLDVMLPDANGFDILQRMKQHPVLKNIPVIMLTGQAKRDSVMRGLAGGADGYVTKPFDVDVLMKGVKSVLGLS